ncbi:MAG: restriction endonuclease subunit S, partial [bacterium]
GSTRYGLSTRSIEQAPILKLPVSEQKRRSDVLREHDRAAAQVRLEAGKLRAIKAGLMSDLLSGQVRVSSCLETAEVR